MFAYLTRKLKRCILRSLFPNYNACKTLPLNLYIELPDSVTLNTGMTSRSFLLRTISSLFRTIQVGTV